jgi:iron complex transport system substrate-binding protein
VPKNIGRTLLTLVLVVATSALACSRTKGAASVAKRVVSLSPSTTETMFAIGAGSALVGRSRYCDFPPVALKLPEVGGYVDPSFEAIVTLAPDLVVGARGPGGTALTDKLAARGVATYFPETESFEAIDGMILGLGARTGHDADARRSVEDIRAHVAAVEASVAGKARPRVLLVFGLEPIVAAGPSTFADEMIRRAGGANAVAEGGGYPTLGMERVLALDPDIVLDAAMAEAHGGERITRDAPGWASLRAVKGSRVVPLADETVLRPGPRVALGLAVVARAIHPDAIVP